MGSQSNGMTRESGDIDLDTMQAPTGAPPRPDLVGAPTVYGASTEDCCVIPAGPESDEAYNAQVAMQLQMEELKASKEAAARAREAQGNGRHIPRPVEGDLDHALAYSMQRSEVENYARRREQMQVEAVTRFSAEEAEFEQQWRRGCCRRLCCGRPPRRNVDPYLEPDPIWGDYPRQEGVQPSKRDKLYWNACPCIVVGCGRVGQRLWRRYLCSLSMLFGVAQVVIFIWVSIINGGFVSMGENIMIGPHFSAQNNVGAKNAAEILYRHEWWRLFTPMMLHAGVVHLGTNLTIQLRSSVALELMWGHANWLLVYMGSGIYATLASCVFSPNTLGVGSSGALCGLIGGWFVFIMVTWNQTLPSHEVMRNAETVSLVLAIGLIVCLSFLPLLDFPAHVGGLIMGGILALNVFAGRMQSLSWRWAARALGLLLLAGVLVPSIWWFLVKTKPKEMLLYLCYGEECDDLEEIPSTTPSSTR